MIKKKDIHLNCTKGATFFGGGEGGRGEVQIYPII